MPIMADPIERGAVAAALAGLPACGSRTLTRLLESHTPSELWQRLKTGGRGLVADTEVSARWHEYAARFDLGALAAALQLHDCVVTTRHDPHHPPAVVTDVEPAAVLFRRGAPVDDALPTVALIGTRRCSPTGREIATELGSGLAGRGVLVVSGLALGIDGAAHRGALAAGGHPPLGVVGSGLDVVYPRANSGLWHDMGVRGTLLSETPLGGRPEPWRFPARNRIIAALADVVVVVESRESGGSMITVDEAIKRGRPVMAVPGSVRNSASAGTNRLIAEGCHPVCGVDDVLVGLGLATAGPSAPLLTDTAAPVERDHVDHELSASDRRLFGLLDFDGSTIDELATAAAVPVAAVAAAVGRLEQLALVTFVDGMVRRRVLPRS